MKLTNKNVLVTGAGSGIGYATCIAFAEAGAHIIATDVADASLQKLRAELRSAGYSCDTHLLDVGSFDAFEQLAAELGRQSRTPHIVVNNAGIGYFGSFEEHDDATWNRVLSVNLMGVVNGCRAFLPLLRAAADDRYLVNVASLASIAPVPNMSAYAASKYAVHGLNEVLAMELAESRVRVLSVHPGIINTAIVRTDGTTAPSITPAQLSRLQQYYVESGCEPKQVAMDIVAAVQKNASQIYTGPLARPTAWLKRILSTGNFRKLLIRNARKVGYLSS